MISIAYDSELFNHVSKIWKSSTSGRANLHWLSVKLKNQSNYRYIFVVQGIPIFLTRDWVTLNTLSISHSPRALAEGTILNASNRESLLAQIIRNYYIDSMRLIGYCITVMLVKSWQYDVELPVLTSWIMEPLNLLWNLDSLSKRIKLKNRDRENKNWTTENILIYNCNFNFYMNQVSADRLRFQFWFPSVTALFTS